MIIIDKIKGLRDWYERLSQRERALIATMGVTFVITLALIVGFVINDGLTTIGERNDAMRQALRDLDTHRDAYLKMKAKESQMETRLGQTPVALGGFLEQAAKESGIAIPDMTDRPPASAGKGWTEKSIDLRLSKVKLDALANFMKRVETGPNLVVTTGLLVRTRDDKHQELDVEMTISTYERAKKKKGDKDEEKEKG